MTIPHTVQELVGYQFAIAKVQTGDEDEPVMTQLILFEPIPTPGGELVFGNQVKFTMSEAMRAEMVRLLTGGVALPSLELKH